MNGFSSRFVHRVGVLSTLAAAVWLLSLDVRSAPSLLGPDELLENQWHLKNRSLEVGGANVRDAWPTSQGSGIVIGIVDDGLQHTHPDLSPNYLASSSYDFNFNDTDPQPFATAAHGTAVAGVAGARGDNTIGVSGVAPLASLAALRLTALAATDAQEASAFGFQPDVIHILNNSWNPTDNGTTMKAPGPLAAAARQSAATTGRQGKGRIFVWSSGNGRLVADDCNFDGYANSRFAIAVGATTDAANHVTTSEGCSALMVLAPSGGGSRALTTTDLIGTPGYDASDYTSAFGGSSTGAMSAAAPTVSGAVALMLARNPNLVWRDVQHILRQTSVRILPADPGWTTGTFPHHERLGFGLLDAAASVAMAATWVSVLVEEVVAPATETVSLPIPDINHTGITSTITISGAESNFVIEHVEVDLDVTHTWRGDLQVKLTSPSGVVSTLAPIRPNDSGNDFANWRFGSVRHWGESPVGVWTLNVADRRFQDVGTWNTWTLRLYGYHTTTSAPGAFGKSSPASGAAGQSTTPTLSWTASTGTASYEYCIDTTNDNACSGWTNNGATASVALSGLSAGTPYYWQVRATNANGTTYAEGSTTAFWSFTTLAPPGAFSHTSPANAATSQSLSPTLAWGTSTGATSYEYCIDTSNNSACNATWISTGGATSAALSGLTAGTAYYWQARAINPDGTTYAEGSATAFWSFTTLALPGAFTHTSPANAAAGQPLSPTLSWGTSTAAASYEYCVDTTNDNACSGWTSTGTNTGVALGGLTAGTAYYWHARATNASGTTYAEGSDTAFWSFTTLPLPGAFTHTSPANAATGQSSNPTLSWGTSSSAASYEYCVDTTNDNACTGWTGTGTNTSVGLGGLTADTAYYWHVRATNASGTTYAEGSITAYWSFVTATVIPAFGQVDTPAQDASGVQGAIGVTGWAVDNAGVTSVKIYRNCLAFEPENCQTVLGQNVVFIGDAVFLEGARPDVAAAYPTFPNNTRAGWGYLMLTLLLPHVPNAEAYGGQGPLTLYVVATDVEGTQTLLGRSSSPASPDFATPTAITLANDSIAKPFGAIDTPAQGETISGVFNNFGWALTPDSNATAEAGDILIPTDGSTMTVFIDGLPTALVNYNQCRGNVGNPVPGGVYCNDDISTIFGNPTPQAPLTTRTSNPTKFRNLDAGRGAIGAYTFDTATLSDGMHTIAWSVTDSAGRTEGIGSRFFNVLNGASLQADGALAAPAKALGLAASVTDAPRVSEGVFGRSGFDLAAPWRTMQATPDDTYAVRLEELGRLELWLGAPVEAGYLVVDDILRPLPVGSSLRESRFAWMPPPGYVGPYELVFVRGSLRINVTVTVVPAPRVVEGEAQIRMGAPSARVRQCSGAPDDQCVRVEGWAFDPQATIGSGIRAVHVWAKRTDASAAVFLGSATLDELRPIKDAPSHSGFSLTASLAPGTYELTAYAWNERTARWEDARSVPVIVR